MSEDGANLNGFDLSIIICSFNTREMTLECLRSIRMQTCNIRYETIIVDNNSADGSVAAIRREFPALRVISLKENIGFARANNLAAKEAKGRRILLLNPDTVVLDRAIERLVAFAEDNPASRLWGGRTIFADGSLNRSSCWRSINLWVLMCFAFGLTGIAPNSRLLNPESYGGWKRDTVREVDIVTGCFFMIDRQMWDQLGGFDPLFFMYGEEADLCYRARKLGAHPTISPSATIIHHGSASDTVAMEKRIKVFRARISLIDKQMWPVSRDLGRALHLLAPVTRWWWYCFAARLTGRQELDQKANYWRVIWERRREWMDGFASDNV